MLRTLFGEPEQDWFFAGTWACEHIAAVATTAKAALSRTVAAVVAAWADSTGEDTWRSPIPSGARILSAPDHLGLPAQRGRAAAARAHAARPA